MSLIPDLTATTVDIPRREFRTWPSASAEGQAFELFIVVKEYRTDIGKLRFR